MDDFKLLKLDVLEKVSSATSEAQLYRVIKSVLPAERQAAGLPAVVEAPNVTDFIESFLVRLRHKLKEHGVRGIIGIGRKFRQHDDNGNGKLDYAEYKKAIYEYGWSKDEISENELKATFQYFDNNCDGNINYDEFLVGVRGKLNANRQVFVDKAFEIMDVNKNGVVDLSDIVSRYSADKHPEVISGKKTKNEVLREFLDTFDGGVKDGTVTKSDWDIYYQNVSASIDDDAYFELMMRNAWHISGGAGQSANTSCRRVLVTHDDGRQTVEEITNDFDIEKDDIAGMMKNLTDRGMKVKNIAVVGSVGDQSSVGLQGDESFSPSKSTSPRQVVHGYRRRGDGGSQIVF